VTRTANAGTSAAATGPSGNAQSGAAATAGVVIRRGSRAAEETVAPEERPGDL
jgi:hypothetical protein